MCIRDSAKLGVSRGDTVAIMLSNRPEFYLVDLAVASLGATPYSIYQTYTPEQIEYLFNDADSKVAVVEQLRQIGLLDDRYLRVRVVEEILDLLGRIGLVDRVRRRAEARDREVHEVELRTVGEHDGHRVAARHAELGQAAGDTVAIMLSN